MKTANKWYHTIINYLDASIRDMKQNKSTCNANIVESNPLCGIKRWVILLLMAVGFSGLAQSATIKDKFNHNHSLYSDVLKKVVKIGMVNYKELKNSPKSLERYLFSLSRVKEKQFKSWTKAQQLAFLINLYNAATLQLIIDHYPVTSIKKIGSWFKDPWDQPVVKLFGKKITLNHLEHQIIRKQYNEPRIHVALVCAANGCPPLRNEAYTGAKLNVQLDDQTKQFLNNPLKFRIDRRAKVVYLSSIFKWYGNDFVSKYSPKQGFTGLNKTQQAIMNFCSHYLKTKEQQFLFKGGYTVSFLNYDWALNKR
ncbi:MAG: DUF547 domain-containing protein [Victivallaceae bacterium]|nr:DUF547 domain-containing protein [Victivallaceae bacterium]